MALRGRDTTINIAEVWLCAGIRLNGEKDMTGDQKLRATVTTVTSPHEV